MSIEDKSPATGFVIPTNELFPIFNEHIQEESNSRIIFSAKFGMGKTYFLKEFFLNGKDEYETFHLFPVNYQIASNDDIIEYLKSDILVQIISRRKDIFKDNDFSSLPDIQRLFYIWGKDNFNEVLKTGLSYVPKLGKPLKDTIELAEKFLDFKKKMEKGEGVNVEEYLANVKKRNIEEPDEFSELLKDKIKKLKGDKTSVLILDDLDRVDPEHIFRVLNVFSAHFSPYDGVQSNKFGFDKIILVADVRNIKSTFHHRFGPDADFSGYFDKFYSNEIFRFKNEDLIEKVVDEIISRFKVEDKDNLDGALGSSGFLRIILKDILVKGVHIDGKEKINLRQLFVGTRTQIAGLKKGSYRKGFAQSQGDSVIQLTNMSIKTLISIVGGHEEDLTNLFKKIRASLDNEKDGKDRISRLLSMHILSVIEPYDRSVDSNSFNWKNYSLDFKNRELVEVLLKDSKRQIPASHLLYDLLIDYVVDRHYLKEVDFY